MGFICGTVVGCQYELFCLNKSLLNIYKSLCLINAIQNVEYEKGRTFFYDQRWRTNPKESSGCISTSIFIPHNTLTIKERIVYDNGWIWAQIDGQLYHLYSYFHSISHSICIQKEYIERYIKVLHSGIYADFGN